MKKLPTGSMLIGEMPEGCKLCQRGLKFVLFITGLCPRRCFYCPLGHDRRYVDIMFANEKKISSIEEAIEEAILMDAMGTGITGGDPLIVYKRTLKSIYLLKRELGKDHHIHLYTTGLISSINLLRDLERVGLNEIRFHTLKPLSILREIKEELHIDVGVEIPMLPDKVKEVEDLLKYLDNIKIDFVNINELEFSETNAISLLERGYELREDSLVAAKGSREAAIEVLEWCEENTSLNVHFCPAIIKDVYQTKLRLYRKAINIAEPFEIITDEGTLVSAEVDLYDINLNGLISILKRLPKGVFKIDFEHKRLILRLDIIEFLIEEFREEGLDIYIREYLPLSNRVLVYEEKL